MSDLISVGWNKRECLVPFYELLTSPATTLLDKWFESDILKTTLATDSVIGSMTPPSEVSGCMYIQNKICISLCVYYSLAQHMFYCIMLWVKLPEERYVIVIIVAMMIFVSE